MLLAHTTGPGLHWEDLILIGLGALMLGGAVWAWLRTRHADAD